MQPRWQRYRGELTLDHHLVKLADVLRVARRLKQLPARRDLDHGRWVVHHPVDKRRSSDELVVTDVVTGGRPLPDSRRIAALTAHRVVLSAAGVRRAHIVMSQPKGMADLVRAELAVALQPPRTDA